ncbi:MAG: hypothetical protein VYA54_05655 [Bdellovibrionota bacterium]|nr:hypothetical protein [Bdellovibrionota bacterium]
MIKLFLLTILLAFSIGLPLKQRLQGAFKLRDVYVSMPTKLAIKENQKEEIVETTMNRVDRAPAIVVNDGEEIDFSDVEAISFTPNYHSNENNSDSDVTFISGISEALDADLNAIKTPTLNNTNNSIKEIKEAAFELSYQKTEEQKFVQAKTLEVVAWTGISVDLLNDNKKEIAFVQDGSSLSKNLATDLSTDRISTEVSAPEKSNSINEEISAPKIPNSKIDEELVFFDYSNSGTEEISQPEKEKSNTNNESNFNGIVQPKKITSVKTPDEKKDKKKSQKKSKKINSSIEENKTESTVPTIADAGDIVDTSKGMLPSINSLMSDLEKAPSLNAKSLAFDSCHKISNNNKEYGYEYSIGVRSIGVTNNFPEHSHFDIRFHDDIDEMVQDFGTGRIKLSGDLQGQMNIRRGTVFSRGHYPTTLDLVLEDTHADIVIPLLSVEKIEEIGTEYNIPDVGAHMLVELDKETEDVDLGLDHKYKAKFFLDKNFNVVDRANSDFYFVFFMGIEPGNTIVKFLDSKSQITSKIVHLSAQEVYYEPNFYADIETDLISMYEEGLMSDCLSILNVNPKEIESWSMVKDAKKESLNTINFENMRYPLGARKYLKLNHLNEPIFVGRWSQEEIAIPTEEYINQILSRFNVRGGECVVQLNLADQPMDILYNGMSTRGGLNLSMLALDKDGRFYQEPSDQTKRAFIMGEEQGIINIQLIYPDNSKRYIQTYCSENTYLVEQL